MRTRDRPWSSAVTRRVLAHEEGTYYGHPVLSQTHQLASRGVQQYQLLAPHVYTSCFRNKALGDEGGVYLSYDQRKNHSVVSSTKTLLRDAGSQPLLTNYSFEASSKKKPLLCLDTINKQLSLSVDDRATGQISTLISPCYLRTINFLSRRAESTSQHRLKGWPLKRDNSTSTEDILNTERSEKDRLFYPNSKIAASDAENTPEITVDTTAKSGMKNRYRKIYETLFQLRPESESPDINDGVTFANIHNGQQSPALGQTPSIVAFPKARSPELPPIAMESTRGDKWKISPSCASSTTGLKIPADRRPAAVSRTYNYSRRHSTATAASSSLSTAMFANRRLNKETLPVCKYHSDSSIYSLSVGGSYPSKGSDSATISSAIPRATEAEDDNISRQCKGDVRSSGVTDAKFLGGRNGNPTLHSAYPSGRLESLHEGQNGRKNAAFSLNNNADNSNSKAAGNYSCNNVDVSDKVTRIQNVNNSIARNSSRQTNNNNVINNIPSALLLPRSVFVKNVINNQNCPSFKVPNRKSRVDGNSTRTNTDYVSRNKFRITRSKSEHKLSEKSTCNRLQENTKAHPTSRNISAERLDKLGPNSQKYRRGVTSSQNQQGGKFQNKSNFVVNINNEYSGQVVNGNCIKEDMYYFEDSSETSDRLVEWLNVVNNIDRYDTDPKDDIIEYSDEPPQTDTAIHLVYDGD